MSVGEIFHVTANVHSIEKAEAFLPLLEVLPLETISNNLESILQAARIKAQYALGYISALVTVTAERENAVLLTGDPEFHKVEEVIDIQWLV